MKTLITFLLLALSFASVGQTISRPTLDKYLKVTTQETSEEIIGQNHFKGYKYHFSKIGDTLLYWVVTITAFHPFSVNEGDNVYLLLSNDTSLKVTCDKGAISKYGYYFKYTGQTSYNCTVLYRISDAMKNTLLQYKIVGLRMYHGDDVITMDNIKDKYAVVFQKSIRLFE